MSDDYDHNAKLIAELPESGRKAIESLKDHGNRVAVLGEFKDGKLQLHSDAVSELAKKYPDARFSFVAVNAPFAAGCTA